MRWSQSYTTRTQSCHSTSARMCGRQHSSSWIRSSCVTEATITSFHTLMQQQRWFHFSNGCVCTPAASHQLLFLVSGRRIGDLNTFGHISSIRVFYVLPYRPGDKRHFPPNFFWIPFYQNSPPWQSTSRIWFCHSIPRRNPLCNLSGGWVLRKRNRKKFGGKCLLSPGLW